MPTMTKVRHGLYRVDVKDDSAFAKDDDGYLVTEYTIENVRSCGHRVWRVQRNDWNVAWLGDFATLEGAVKQLLLEVPHVIWEG